MAEPEEGGEGWRARLFGRFSWAPPPWWKRLRERQVPSPAEFFANALRRTREDPAARRRATGLAAAFLLLVIGVFWYRTRARAVVFSVAATSPGPTKLGEILHPEAIHIRFGGPSAKLSDVGKPAVRGIVITPPILGIWRWDSDSVLTFTPKQDWAVGQEYTVTLDKSLFPEHVRLERYWARFKSAPFTAQVSSAQFYLDPKNPKIKQAVWTVAFSHAVDTSDFEKRLSVVMAGQGGGGLFGFGQESSHFTLSYDKYKSEAYVRSPTIAIPEKDTSITLTVAAGSRSVRGGPASDAKLESPVAIPGIYSFFRVQAAELALPRNERYEPEQVLVLNMSAGATTEEIQKHISAWALPRDYAPDPSRPPVRNFHWYDPARIGPEILTLSSPVPLAPIATDQEYAALHSFRFSAEPGRFLYIRMTKGAQSYGDYVLAKDYDVIAQVPAFPKELNIMADGALLSLSGDKKLSVVSRGIEAIRFSIGRVLPGQINHLVSQSGGEFKSPQFQNYNFNQENIAERFTETRELEHVDAAKTQYSALDLAPYLSAGEEPGHVRGLFFLKAEAWDPLRKRTIGVEDNRLVLVTDMGLLVKDNRDGSHDVFVQSIHGGEPVAGARVEVVGKNGLPVLTATTDEQGRAYFPTLTGFDREKKPTVYVARRGQDLSFIPYDWSDRHLDFSRFDVGGAVSQEGAGGLTAYLFSDRGLYRPGDEIRIGLIIKASDWARSLAGVPVELAVMDPRGLEVMKRKISLSADGFEEIRHRTEETSPTGRYQVSAYVVKDGRRESLLGSTEVRVEEFLPDRMKIATSLSSERVQGWVSPHDLKAFVTLKTLFGIPAADRRVSAQITLSPTPAAFASYPDHVFFDPLRAKHSFNERLEDRNTSGKGEAEFDLGLERFEKATYRLSFVADGYEAEGGRSVTSQSSVIVSDLPHLLGYKPDGDLKYLHKDSERAVEIIAVDPALKKVGVSGLTAVLLEQRYVSVLQRQNNGTYKYESVLKEIPSPGKRLDVPATGLSYALPTAKPGDFVLLIKNAEDTELCRVPFSVVGAANITRSLEKNAELQIKLDKSDYAPGEAIELQIRSPYTGAGLITIERDRVYAVKWFKTETTNSVQHIVIPPGLEGNAYVNVSFIRAMGSPEIFMSPLSYGVAPFSLSRESRTNAIALTTPELARPGEPFRIRYSSRKRGKIVLFAVDEGILQVAGYKTPDPLGRFFAKRALEVRTMQILDLILPEFKMLESLSSPGGDEGAKALGQNLNPFKRRRDPPVAFWSGIRDSGPEQREVVYHVPDSFNGTLRVMAVVVAQDSLGVAEKKSFVRGHFTLSPNVAAFAAPSDEFTVSVGVANNVEGSGANAAVTLALTAPEQAEVLDGASRTFAISEGREATATFRLRVKNALGSAHLVFSASRGDKRSSYAVDFSVRPPVAYRTTSAAGHFRGGSAKAAVPRRMHPEYRVLEAAASTVPLGLAHGLALYLEKYPYLCTEQLVSQAWPALVLRSRPEFGYSPEKAAASLDSILRVLRSRQNAEGAFGMWAANSHVSDFQTVYAAHFLTEAKERGYPVPADLLSRALVYLRNLAGGDGGGLPEERLRAYASYVLTRNGLLTTTYVGAIQSRLERQPQQEWRKDLTAAYLAAAHKLMQAQGKADALASGLKLGETSAPDYENYYDGLVRDSQLLYLVSKHFPERLRGFGGDELLHIADPVSRGSYNTLSSAYAILALNAYADAVGTPEAGGLTIAEIAADGSAKPLPLPGGLFPKVKFSDSAREVQFASPGGKPVFYSATQAGFDSALPDKAIATRLEISREYRDASGKVLASAPLGAEVEVHLRLRTTDGSSLSNVAAVDLLPGGFEPVIDSLPRAALKDDSVRRTESSSGEGEGEGEGEGAPAPAPSAAPGPAGWAPDYVDVREDRVVIIGSVGATAREIVYKIKATNRGTYVAPPPYGESMYDRAVQAQGVAGKMTVE